MNAQGAANAGGDARDRRMWFNTNPATVRGILTGAATVANRRQQDGLTLVDVTLREGDRLTLALRPPSNLPQWISWIGPNQNLGEMTGGTSSSRSCTSTATTSTHRLPTSPPTRRFRRRRRD
ncbi:MAG: hypothetical protein WBD07_10815 [Vicinamibacterales bacterium]